MQGVIMRPIWIAPLLFASLIAQETPPAGTGTKPVAAEASAAKQTPLERLRAADEAGRSAALIAFVDGCIATGAVYSGQYEALAELGWDATPMLRAWVKKAPKEAKEDPHGPVKVGRLFLV
jgi:hypothetical protein